MKQKLPFLSFIILLLILFIVPSVQASEDPDKASAPLSPAELVDNQLNTMDLTELKKYWEDITTKYGGFLPESQKGSLYDFVKGDKVFSFQQWGKGILKFAFQEFIANGKLLGSLIMLTAFSMFLQSLQTAFEKSAISKVAYAIVFMVLVILALNSFHVAIDYRKRNHRDDDLLCDGVNPSTACNYCCFWGAGICRVLSSGDFVPNEYERHVISIYYFAAAVSCYSFKHRQHAF